MAPQGYDEARKEYTAAFGEMVVAWNVAENMLRLLLYTLCGKTTAVRILTAELSAMGIVQGLNSISDTLYGPVKDAVLTVCARYDRMREYRNYYVHGIAAVSYSEGIAEGTAYMVSAKNELRVAIDRVPADQLNNLNDHLVRLQQSTIAILDTIDPQEGSAAFPPLPSLERSPLPDRLTKTLRYPLRGQPAPGSPPPS
jgi:hypothetical protein